MNEKTLKDLLSSLRDAGKPKTSAYDTTATVTRVEGGTAWVHIPGGVTETPVKLTISAKAGDTVQVRVSGGRAFMVGNASAPPTDDTVATSAVKQVSTIRKVVEKVREVAETASRIAGNTNQYFWHTETGTDTGAHITEIPQEEFLADPENGGGNLLARSNGVAVRDGLKELSRFSADGLEVLGYDGNDNEVEVAHLGYGEARDQTMQMTTAPYASLGYRLPNSVVGAYSTAEGHSTTASGHASHAEGALTTSSGGNAHAEGGGTVASGSNSHAGGWGTVAAGPHQTAIGRYNVADIYGDNLFIVGNGTDNNNRSNAFAVTSQGALVAGGVKSYTPTWANGQSPENFHCVVSAGLCSIFYQGPSTTHTTNTLLGTLPAGARPTSNVFCPFVKASVAYGTIRIETNGSIYVGFISSTTASNRIYFNCSFPVV